MPCDKPLHAFQLKNSKTANGKAVILFQYPNHRQSFERTQLACGRCTGCRLERSKNWAIRCIHEAHLHEENYFITFTYDDTNLPWNNSLRPRDLSLFFKRLRKKQNVRYYAVGEYGDLLGRPHYHAIIFNLRLDDLLPYSYNNGNRLYTSNMLSKLWYNEDTKEILGNVYIGHVTFESAAYCARYILKKQLGHNALKLYYDKDTDTYYDKETGLDYVGEIPEFVRMSRNPGIGAGFFELYKSQFYQKGNNGTVSIRGGVISNTPRYYDNRYEKLDSGRIETIKQQRRAKAEASQKLPRNRRATVGLRNTRITALKRKLENE